MEKLKFTLFSVVILSLVGLLLYWSITTIQSGSDHATNQKVSDLQKENESLKKEVDDLTGKLSALTPAVSGDVAQTPSSQPTTTTPKPVVTPTKTTTYKNQSLINELQKLIDDNIYMKLKSSGTRVGTVQNFLNIYNTTSNKVDNDYGAGTVNLVMAFQKAEGLTVDGGAGPTTFKKMIEWLKAQG